MGRPHATSTPPTTSSGFLEDTRACRKDTEKLALYPEERRCKQPTAEQVLSLFALAQRNVLSRQGSIVEVFEPRFTDLQRQALRLLGVPIRAYRCG